MNPNCMAWLKIKIVFVLVMALLLSACSQSVVYTPDPTSGSSATPVATLDYMQELILTSIRSSFSASAHAEKLTCAQCHPSDGDVVKKELVWFNNVTQQIEPLSNTIELCSKCHPDQNHLAIVGGSIVLAHPDFECATCHDAHNIQATCTQSTCHSNIQKVRSAQVEKPEFHPTTGDANSYMCGGSTCHDLAKQVVAEPIYHQPVHRTVPCYVCHDVSGLPVTSSDKAAWLTVGYGMSVANVENEEVVSHQIGREVNCAKCHYTDNPWELIDNLSSN